MLRQWMKEANPSNEVSLICVLADNLLTLKLERPNPNL
jgi:hypothetical protein